jgi:polysaccharide pyruvyl transferase WcaK-like protein
MEISKSSHSRRVLLAGVATTMLTSLVSRDCMSANSASVDAEPRKILLRSSWQTVNIGDIAHTPGVLALLEKYLPNAEIWLWPSNVGNGVRELLVARFPKLKIVDTQSGIAEAFKECDFLLHGSGPYLVAKKHVQRWVDETGKPFGVYGITLPFKPSADTPSGDFQKTIALLSLAEFVFFRDSHSLRRAKESGCKSPIIEFGPDGAFGTDLRDDRSATEFLAKNQLKVGKFLCCIPRLRFTPYWLIPEKKQEIDPIAHARNEEMKEHDHAPLRQAILDVIRETDLKILICPEDRTQMAIGKEQLLDRLPSDLLPRVVWRPDYWLTAEALSTYSMSAGLFGHEMHSPIMCVGNGIPAIVGRWSEQTSKGFMWQDIGLGEWLFDLDNAEDVARMPKTVLEMATHLPESRAKAARAQAFVQERQRATMSILERVSRPKS